MATVPNSSGFTLTGFLGVATPSELDLSLSFLFSENNNNRAYFQYYKTVVRGYNSGTGEICRWPAALRVYTPQNQARFPDDTVLFVVAKLWVPDMTQGTSGVLALDAMEATPFPGDPSLPSYEAAMPNSDYPWITACGKASSPEVESIPGPNAKLDRCLSFSIKGSEYVRDSLRLSHIRCLYDVSIPRWRKSIVPRMNSTIIAMGHVCPDDTGNCLLGLSIEHVTFNVPINAPPTANESSTSTTPIDPALPPTPNKKRRFPNSIDLDPVDSDHPPPLISPSISNDTAASQPLTNSHRGRGRPRKDVAAAAVAAYTSKSENKAGSSSKRPLVESQAVPSLDFFDTIAMDVEGSDASDGVALANSAKVKDKRKRKAAA